jgi:hypothetical protein
MLGGLRRSLASSRHAHFMHHRYRPDVLAQLVVHGVNPKPSTPPELVRDFLNDLYRYELRRLRDRLVRREIAKPDYYAHVVEVRRRYPLLSRRLWEWIEE